MDTDMDFRNVLSHNGLKITVHRIEILKTLFLLDKPQSADEIYKILLKKNTEMNFSTLYRNLDFLVSKHVVSSMYVSERQCKLYEYNLHDHKHYFICVDCKKVFPLTDCPLHEYEKEIEERTGNHAIGHDLTIYGYCKDCLKNKEKQIF